MGAEAHWPCTNGLHPVRQCGRVLRVHGILPHSADIPTRVRRGSQWRGGAKPHGPKIRSWGQKLNKKGVLCWGCALLWRSISRGCHPTPMSVRALGLRMALAAAYHDRRLAVVDGVELEVRACVWVDAVALHVSTAWCCEQSAKTGDLASLLRQHGWDDTRVLLIDGTLRWHLQRPRWWRLHCRLTS